MKRAALYARFSTDQQSDASVEDQLRLCRITAEALGAVVVAEFHDAGISGQTMLARPGVRALMALAKARGCDLVIAENTDRLSRAGEHSWAIYKRLEAAGVQYVTVNQGAVTKLHVGLSGLMSELFIEEIGRKTRRGQEGVVLAGRAMGSLAYGYRTVIAHDAKGDRIPGLREIDQERAAVVVRIFRDYAAGVSPWALVTALNNEGVPSPRGGPWERSTIIGNPLRGHGMLRNELYRGVRVWGRMAFRKDPESGARLASLGTGSVHRVEVPALRIVPEDLWSRVQLRLAETAIGPNGEGRGRRRPGYLLAGLIRCGVCGGPMSASGAGGLRCRTRADNGAAACSNTRSPGYARLEARVLTGVLDNLLHPEAIAEAVKAFNAVLVEERRETGNPRARLAAELGEIDRRDKLLMQSIEDGAPWAAIKDRHAQLQARRAVIEGQLAALEQTAEVLRLPAGAAREYRDLVRNLGKELAGEDAAPGRGRVRALIEEVKFLPLDRHGCYDLEVSADLAPLVNIGATEPVRAGESRSRFIRSHTIPVRFRLAG